jgi:hypothetical protein
MAKKSAKKAAASSKKPARKPAIPDKNKVPVSESLPTKPGFDISDQDSKRRIGNFGGAGEPHMQKRGRGDR